MTDRFQPERWSLFIELDPPAPHEPDERRLLERYVRKTFGGLPEEYDEVLRTHDDGRIEVASETIDWLADVMSWVTDYCIPRQVRLVRNDERSP
jgi:hypothetical protein